MSPMTVPSITFQLRADKLREDGTAPIRIRSYHQGRSSYCSTGVRCRPSHWNKKKSRVKGSAPLAALHNRRLDELYAQAVAASYEANTSAEVIAKLTGGGSSFSGYAQSAIAGMKQDGAYWRRRKMEGVLRKVHAVLGEPVSWAALTPEALRRIERYMREQLNNSSNTVRTELDRLRALVNQAIMDGVLSVVDNPFTQYKMPRAMPTERRRLTIEEVQRIADLELAGGTRLRVVRDAWLTQFYGAGVRISDLLLLGEKSIVDGRLNYRAQKTGKLHSIELPPRAVAILAPYRKALHQRMMQPPNTRPNPFLFDALMAHGDDSSKEDVRRRQHRATSKINKGLKQIAEAAGIDPKGFSSHSARHTFASAAWKHGSPQTVQALLGHSSVAQTEAYVSTMDTSATDALTQAMWRDAGV